MNLVKSPFIFLILLIYAPLMFGQTKPANTLPPQWFGHWKGQLQIKSVSGNKQEVNMELIIQPIKGDKPLYTWTIIYGEGEKKQTRSYELVPTDEAGHFFIDEKNGIKIDTWLMDNVFFDQFKVGDTLISSRNELKDGKLIYELTSYSTKTPRKSEAKENSDLGFEGYSFRSVQRAVLSKLPN